MGSNRSFHSDPKRVLENVMGYQNEDLIDRLQERDSLSEETARFAFEDLKRFLYLSHVTDQSIAPPPAIDVAWHQFLIDTLEYEHFCKTFFGSFIHHSPRKKSDAPDPAIRERTLALAKEHFTNLSRNWHFSIPKGNRMSHPEDCSACDDRCRACGSDCR